MKSKNILSALFFLIYLPLSAQTDNYTDNKNPGLQHLIRSALNNHPSIRAKRYERLSAAAELDAARWQYFPTPSTSVQAFNKRENIATDTRLTTIGLKQPIWTNGRLEALKDNANAKRFIADAALRELERDLALELIQVWGELKIALARLQIFNKSILKHEESLSQIQRRANEGLSAQSDVLLAYGRLNAVKAERIQAIASIDSNQKRLENLVGGTVEIESIGSVTSKPVSGLDAVLDMQQLEDPSSEPTLSRLQAEILLIESEIKNTKAALLPEVSAQVVNRQGDVSGNVTQWFIGLESRWGAGLSQRSSAEAIQQRRDAKLAEIEVRKIKFKDQLRIEFNNLGSARQRLKSFEAVLQTSNDVAASWDRQFLSGKKTWQDVMNAVREISQGEIQVAEASIGMLVSGWRLSILQKGLTTVLELNP